MSMIEDGKGSGSSAEVRKHILQVSTEDPALRAALNGDAYVMHIDGITSSADDYILALIINEDAKARDMIVAKVELAGETNDNCILEINLGGTFSATIANTTAVVPGNINGASRKPAGGLFYVNDGSGDMTTETGAYVGYAQKQALENYSAQLKIDGGWVIPHGQSISVSATKDGKYTGCIHFYYRD